MKNIKLLFFVVALLATLTFSLGAQEMSHNLQKAYESYNEDDNSKALELVAQELKTNPKCADAYFLKGMISVVESKTGEALTAMNEAIRLYNKKNTCMPLYRMYWWRATIYNSIDESVKAEADYLAAIKFAVKAQNSNDAKSIRLALADLYFSENQLAKSEELYLDVLKDNEADEMALVGLARNFRETGEFDAALKFLAKAEALNPEYSAIYKFRMQVLDAQGETDKAIDEGIKYLKIDDRADFNIVSDVFYKHTTYAIAKISLEIKKDYDNKRMWMAIRAYIYEHEKNYEKYLDQLNEIENEYGRESYLNAYRADAYTELGACNAALVEINKALDEDPEDTYYLATKGEILRLLGCYQDAITEWDKLISLDPTIALGYERKGWCYEFMGDNDHALECYNEGIDIDKSYSYIYLHRGEQYLLRGENDLARQDFETILQIDTLVGGNTCRHYALAFLGHSDEAQQWMDSIIAESPNDSGNYYDKACLLCRMNRPNEAMAALQLAVDKGYRRSVHHILHDDDLNPLRDRDDFELLVADLAEKVAAAEAKYAPSSDPQTTGAVSVLPMRRHSGGTYEVACTINGLPLQMLFDTGASDVTLSSVEANFMFKNGYLKESDIKGKRYYSIANGGIVEGTTVTLREVKVGETVLRNVDASVVKNQTAPLLLGQSVFERFATITIDNSASTITVRQ